MGRIHKATTFALILHLTGLVSLFLAYPLLSSLFFLLAFFSAIKDLPVYTSYFQFLTIVASALMLGVSIDFPHQHFPLTTLALLLMAAVAITRVAFFRVFSYTSYSWFEPLVLLLAVGVYFASNLMYAHNWPGYVFPLPVLLFDLVFTWGTLKDKNQLLKNARGGYRVQIGKEANEFELPDQDGNLIKLSHYRNKRHVLLIFVRGDWCPGCHMMLRTYEKNNARFQSKNILVMAIGPDPVGVNRQMVEKLGLDFKVLSDAGQKTAMIYGVQLKDYDNAFAEKYEEGIPLPASFLIDKTGIVRYVSRPDKVGEFLNPSLIFPIIEQLDAKHSREDMHPETEAHATNSRAGDAEMESLKKQLRNYESIIDQANDAMIVIDIVDGKIHQSNPSASQLLGYTQQELETLSLFDLHPKELLDKSSRIVADVWEKKGLIYTDIPFITKSQELIPVECSAKVAPFAGRPAIVIYARDIRERLKMEMQLTSQRKLIDQKNKDITDSIEYSKRIQRSIFKDKENLKAYAPDSFIFFKPKDVVSGDFYWFTNYTIKKDYASADGAKYLAGTEVLVIAAVDCTGHGVPGAFMSIIANSLLNQTILQDEMRNPANALDYIDAELKKSLNKNQEDTPLRDGMDLALCCIDRVGMIMEYAGANNPVYLVRGSELLILKADKQPITASNDAGVKHFSNQRVLLQKGDAIYLFTDGFADQFGGPEEKKFMYKRFKEMLLALQDKPMKEQGIILEQTFADWKGQQEQVDDVLVIGIRI